MTPLSLYILEPVFFSFFFWGGGGRGEVSNLMIDRGLAVKPIYNQVRFIYVKSRFAFGQFGIF